MNWQDKARLYAKKYGVPENIVLATIEAETGGRNVLGDGGNALGYGQVWAKKWHYDKLLSVARDLGVVVPAQSAPIEDFQRLILGNDDLSMALAVKTIGAFWEGAGQDWLRFTKSYVGPAIPQADIIRREKIWNKYKDQAPVETGVLEGTKKADKPYYKDGQIVIPVPEDDEKMVLMVVLGVLGVIALSGLAGLGREG